MRRAHFRFLYFLCFLNLICFLSACHQPPQSKITIGSKFFTEQVVLAELLAQHIEARTGIPVIRKTNLGGTLLVLNAIPPPSTTASSSSIPTASILKSPSRSASKTPSPWSSAATTRKISICKKFPMSRRLPPNGAPVPATNSSSAPTVSAASAKTTVSILPSPPKSWTSASSTAPSSIIKWTSSPATPPTASSTPSGSSPSLTTATTSRRTTPSP